MIDKEEARARLITMAQNESLGLEREALIIGANALIDNENLWLEAHDKQIRTEVVDEIMQYVRLHRKFAEYQSNDFVFYYPMYEWLEQLKENKT